MREGKRALVSGAIFGGLLLLCLWFVGWIGRLAFDNTCIELKEQYINSAAGETAGEIVAGVNFGKSIDSFYGMDQILERFQALSPGNMEAAVLGAMACRDICPLRKKSTGGNTWPGFWAVHTRKRSARPWRRAGEPSRLEAAGAWSFR